jgi:hypothetical protein
MGIHDLLTDDKKMEIHKYVSSLKLTELKKQLSKIESLIQTSLQNQDKETKSSIDKWIWTDGKVELDQKAKAMMIEYQYLVEKKERLSHEYSNREFIKEFRKEYPHLYKVFMIKFKKLYNDLLKVTRAKEIVRVNKNYLKMLFASVVSDSIDEPTKKYLVSEEYLRRDPYLQSITVNHTQFVFALANFLLNINKLNSNELTGAINELSSQLKPFRTKNIPERTMKMYNEILELQKQLINDYNNIEGATKQDTSISKAVNIYLHRTKSKVTRSEVNRISNAIYKNQSRGLLPRNG